MGLSICLRHRTPRQVHDNHSQSYKVRKTDVILYSQNRRDAVCPGFMSKLLACGVSIPTHLSLHPAVFSANGERVRDSRLFEGGRQVHAGADQLRNHKRGPSRPTHTCTPIEENSIRHASEVERFVAVTYGKGKPPGFAYDQVMFWEGEVFNRNRSGALPFSALELIRNTLHAFCTGS